MEQVGKPKERSAFLDLMKGIAIILVVLGHAIQYGSGINFLTNNFFYERVVFKVIYSFHMPLFMIISGYLFGTTINKYSIKKLLLSRITKLLIPVFVWNCLFLMLHFTAHFIHHTFMLHEIVEIDLITGLMSYISSSFQTIWFLWAIFWCSLLVVLSNKLFKDSIFVYLIAFILTFILPDSYNMALYKFMYPFFVIGYFYKKNKEIVMSFFSEIKDIYLLLITGVIYLFIMLFYKQNSYIYDRGFTIIDKDMLNQIILDFYMLIVGLAGSVFVILIVNYFFKNHIFSKGNYITKLGLNSLGIYIISNYLFIFVQKLTVNLSSNFFLIFVETIVVLIISYFLISILKRHKVLNILLFGGR